jgi:ArsR family transcriptional regulator
MVDHGTASVPPPIDAARLERAAEISKCLGHPLRLRLLEALETGERTVKDLQECSGASQPVVSQQLRTLKSHGVVDSRCEHTYHYYRIVETRVPHVLTCLRPQENEAQQ